MDREKRECNAIEYKYETKEKEMKKKPVKQV